MQINNPRPTRYPELGYTKIVAVNSSHPIWRIVEMEDRTVVGPHYRTKAALLADLPRYAAEYGCE